MNIKGKTPREVKVHLLDVMGNKYLWTFKRNHEGDYKISTHGDAYSNFQCKVDKYEIEWLADTGDWDSVIQEINRGVKIVTKMQSRD